MDKIMDYICVVQFYEYVFQFDLYDDDLYYVFEEIYKNQVDEEFVGLFVNLYLVYVDIVVEQFFECFEILKCVVYVFEVQFQ